ncbi:hypothetical protein HMPREF1155_0556 [Slackia sp. CM382]|nr:hypothetical protein HMPREF1155_0556 [Slackia sp. CM382]
MQYHRRASGSRVEEGARTCRLLGLAEDLQVAVEKHSHVDEDV